MESQQNTPEPAPGCFRFTFTLVLLAVMLASRAHVALAQIPPAETLFVSVYGFPGGLPGNDSTGNGSRFAPFREISYAMLQVVSRNAHVVFVAPSRGNFYSDNISTPYNRNLKIVSEKGPDSTYIRGTDGFSVVTLLASVSLQILEGFTIADKPGLLSCEGACSGAVYAYGRTWIINNKIVRNVGEGLGGGISYYGITGVVGIIAGNWIADNTDAGIFVNNSTGLVIINNTIVSNSSPAGAGILLSAGATNVTIANNIVAYNHPGYGIYQVSPVSSDSSGKVAVIPNSATVTYNLFYQNTAGNTLNLPTPDGTNITGVGANPFLFDRTSKDYHITCASPARNTGNKNLVPSELTSSGDFTWDIDGPPQARIFPSFGAIDIGSDEFYDTHKHVDFQATPNIGCNSLVATFANFSTCIDEHWTWDFGDGSDLVFDVKEPTHTYASPGLYTVTLIARGDLSSDTLTRTGYIRVALPLVVSFTADTVKACDSLTATFTAATSTDADSLRWSFGDGGTALGNPVTHKFTKIGNFDVVLTGYNPCGATVSSRTAYISIGTKPTIDIAASIDSLSGPRCIPYDVRLYSLTNQPLTNWEWDFGDSDTTGSKLENPTHTYRRTGTFSVRLIATGGCGSDTAIRLNYLEILTRPTATIDANPKAVCASGQTVNFTATYHGVVDSSRWLFGNGASSPGPATNYLYPSAGVYQPKLILYHPCAVDTLPLSSTVAVGTLPHATLYGAPRSGFEPLITQFADSSRDVPTSWQWAFGDGSSSADKNPAHTYAAGNWNVKLTVSNVCGTSVDSIPRYVHVGGFSPSLDSAGVLGDTILFSVLVDSLYQRYDRAISLSGALAAVPRRGSASFVLDAPAGTPRFTTTMKMIPSGDLPTGDYTVRLSAVDPRITKSADRTVHVTGHQLIDVRPDTIQFGKLVIGGQYSKQAYVINRAPRTSGYRLNYTVSDSGQGFIAAASGALNPQESTVVQVSFIPARRGEYLGAMIVTSDDPVLTRDRIVLRGRGTPDLVLPRVASTVPAVPFEELRIDSTVRIIMSEPVIAASADSLLIITAKRSPSPVVGHLTFSSGTSLRPWTWISFTPDPCVWFPPDDTLRIRLRAVLTDTAENGLDGDSNAIDEGSPADDYLFSLSTGPGVRPGDADQDRRVDERDILPLARYWGMTGPARQNVCDGFVVQPASSWDPRAATHADADGNGTIDSADVCPIARYFDMNAAVPKEAVESWMSEARTWDRSMVRSLVNGLVNCPDAGQGQAVLLRFLENVQAGSIVPAEYTLSQNYPNPFNPSTVIEYSLKSRTKVRIEVFDIMGRLVTVLEDTEQNAGPHSRIWDGTDAEGRMVASGIYFYRLVTPEFRMARKMVLMK